MPTSAPSCANASTMPLPIPCCAPVTSAILPASDTAMLSVRWWSSRPPRTNSPGALRTPSGICLTMDRRSKHAARDGRPWSLGHFAVRVEANRAAPRASLGTLMMAPLLPDLLWPIFLLVGLERVRIDPGNTAFTPLDFVSYPYTHSLLATLIWAGLFAALYRARSGYDRGAILIAVGVVSHWVLDAVSHRPDLPLVPGGALRLGLGLWNSVTATLMVEIAMFATGVWLYVGTARARNRRGRLALAGVVLVLGGIYVGNLAGPPPPSETALALVALGAWLFVPWFYWIDRNRVASGTGSAPPRGEA